MSSLFKGPLPVLVLGAAVVFGMRYLPLDDILERIAPGRGEPAERSQVAVSPPSAAAIVERPAAKPPAKPANPLGPPAALEEGIDASAVASAPEVEPDRAVATAEAPQAPAAARPAPPAVVATPPPDAVAEVAPVVAPAPAERPLETPPAAVAEAINERPPPSVAAAKPKLTPEPKRESKPAAVVRPAPAAAASKPPVVASVGTPVVAPAPVARPEPKPVLPNLRVFVEADVDEEAGLGSYSAVEYARKLQAELAAAVRDQLGPGAVPGNDANLAFRDRLAEGRPGIEELCRAARARRMLMADLTVPSAGFSTLPSAYWPEVAFVAVNCVDGRMRQSPKQRLEPHRLDVFDYQQFFARRSKEFISSQGYFLEP